MTGIFRFEINGSIVINHFGGVVYYLTTVPWMGLPNTDVCDVQSGIGFVNNLLMFDRSHKSVVYGPFDSPLDPNLVNVPNNHRYFV